MKEKLRSFLSKRIHQYFSCYDLHVLYKKQIAIRLFEGRYDSNPFSEKINENSVFDLASLTKVFSTTVAIMHLIDTKKLSLDSQVSQFIKLFQSQEKNAITIRQLLTHSSGFQAFYPLYKNSHNFEKNIAFLSQIQLEVPPDTKTIYSCLNFFLLEYIFWKLMHQHTSEFFKMNFIIPMKLKNFQFAPINTGIQDIVATSFIKDKKEFRKGKTDDANSREMKLNCANAGLFGDIDSIVRYLSMFRNEGQIEGKRYLSKKSIQSMMTNQNKISLDPRGLGWDLKNDLKNNSSCGQYFSKESFGHTGFTGTSVWIDPINEIEVIFLSNKTLYPDNNKNGEFYKFRRELHDFIFLELKS